MSIWFYLFLIVSCISIFLTFKILLMKHEIKNIGKSLSYILKSDTNHLITINTNEKNLKKLAALLNRSLKELRRLELEYKNGNQELKTSITNISHDLRTPLTAIRCYLELLDDEKSREKQRSYLNIICNKVSDLIELTEQLFDFSKAMDINHDISYDNVCVNHVLEDTIASFYSLFDQYNIKPHIDLTEDKVMRFLNENLLKRVFENIISNAIKYSKGDFQIKLYHDGKIEFSNKTDELDQVSLEQLFCRYYTVNNAKKSNGIGLSIAKQLLSLMHGTIEAKYKNNRLSIIVQL